MTVKLKDFSAANRRRCESPEGFDHRFDEWSKAEWSNALAGEAGEACNLTKKMLRHEKGSRGNVKPEDQDYESLRRRAAKEAADAIIYADLLIQALGFEPSEVVREVFDSKSEQIGWPERL